MRTVSLTSLVPVTAATHLWPVTAGMNLSDEAADPPQPS